MDSEAEGFAGLLGHRARAEPARIFAHYEGEPITFARLDRASDCFAAHLRAEGIARGERVGVMLRNGFPALAVMFGLARAGVVWVPINPAQKGEGLRFILDDADLSLLVAEADLLPVVAASGHAAKAAIASGGEADGLAAILDGAAPFTEPFPAGEDELAIMYTSGTTGPPKGVRVTHAMMCTSAAAALIVSDAQDGDVLFVWEPLYHIGGAQLTLLPLLRRIRLAMVARFSVSRFWSQVRETRATHIHYLGGILHRLLIQEPQGDDRDHKVRIAWGAGCPQSIWRAFSDRFGVRLRECYGMTEAASITTCNGDDIAGSIGRPLPWFDVKIVDASGARIDAPGKHGQLGVRPRKPGVLFEGYFRRGPVELDGEGFFMTGDLVSADAAGNLRFHGRASDSVRHRGENVSAWEVERVAVQHDAIEECAIIGVPAEDGEQDIKLFAKLRAGDALREDELHAWLAERLPRYQVPRYIAFVPAFEQTPSGRIMKHRLPATVAGCWDREAPGEGNGRAGRRTEHVQG